MEMINLLPLKEQEYMRNIFADCPQEIKDDLKIIEVPKGKNFIDAGSECRNVYIILKGIACGIDMQLQGRVYRFKEFKPGRFLGDFESMAGLADYFITVQAVTNCIVGVLSAPNYVRWMKVDGNALFLRTQSLLYELAVQTRDSRRFFLSTCRERLIQYLVDWYERAQQEVLCLHKTREELANEIGFVVRTIDRNLIKLAEGNYISIKSGKVYISFRQYKKMEGHLKQNLTYKEE